MNEEIGQFLLRFRLVPDSSDGFRCDVELSKKNMPEEAIIGYMQTVLNYFKDRRDEAFRKYMKT